MKIGKSRLQQIIREELSRKLSEGSGVRESAGVLVMKNRQLDEAAVLVLGGAIITAEMIAASLGISLAVVGTAWLIDIATELGWDYYDSEAEAREAISQAMPRVNPDLRLPASSGYRPTSEELAASLALSATAQNLAAESEQGSDSPVFGSSPTSQRDPGRRIPPLQSIEWDDTEDERLRGFNEYWSFAIKSGSGSTGFVTHYYLNMSDFSTGPYELYDVLGTNSPESDESYFSDLDLGVGVLPGQGESELEVSHSAIERLMDKAIAYAETPWQNGSTPFTADSEICDAQLNVAGRYERELRSIYKIPDDYTVLGPVMSLSDPTMRDPCEWALLMTAHDESGTWGAQIPIVSEGGSYMGEHLIVMDEVRVALSEGKCSNCISDIAG